MFCNHYKQKHSLDKLLDSLLIILLKGIPYCDIYKFTKIPWQNNKKSQIFIQFCNLFEILFSNIIDNYVKEIKKLSNIFNNESPIILNTDTLLIVNKLGVDMISHNPQL